MYTSDRLVVQQITTMDLGNHESVWVKILNVGIPLNVLTVCFSVGDKQVYIDWNENLWLELHRIVTFVKASIY